MILIIMKKMILIIMVMMNDEDHDFHREAPTRPRRSSRTRSTPSGMVISSRLAC
jgi:hypothetical protein